MPVGRDRARELFKAAKTGDVYTIERLLGTRKKGTGSVRKGPKGPNANVQDESGLTPLHYAAMNGFNDAVQLILLCGASAHIADNSGSYPIHLAAWKGDIEVARTLIERGPSQADVDAQSRCEETALHLSAQYGHREVVEYLLEQKADAYVRNNKGETALDLAAQFGHVDVVNLLIRFNPALLSTEFSASSPLHLASRNGHVAVVLALITAGLSVNTLCDCGTALHEAALFGKSEVVKLLMQRGTNITLTDKNGRTVFDVLDQYPTTRSQQIKDIIVGTSQTADRQLPSVAGDGNHDDEGISSVNNPVYDSAAGALQQMTEDGLDQSRIFLSERLNQVSKKMVCAVARVDYQDSSHSKALRLCVGDRIRVIGLNSNGTYIGLSGEMEGSFFASHVDFYQVIRGKDVLISPDDIQVSQLRMPHEDPLDQVAPPHPLPCSSSAPTSLLNAFNEDSIAALRSSSSYAQLNPVLKEDGEDSPHQIRFRLKEEPPATGVAQHAYTEVTLVSEPPIAGTEGRPSSRSGLSLQEAMKSAPAMSEEEKDKAAHPYSNLSKGVHNYLNFDQAQKNTSDDYIRLPQMVASEEARRALNRSPFERALNDEEKAFMRDTWEGVADGDTPPSAPRMKLSLGDLENELLMKQLKTEDDPDQIVFDSGDSVRQDIRTPEMGNILRGRDPFSTKGGNYGNKKFKSHLLHKASDPIIASPDRHVTTGRQSPIYDPNPPRCYEWSKFKELPPEVPPMGPPTPPPPRLVRARTGDGITGVSSVYQNVVVKPVPRPRSKPPPHPTPPSDKDYSSGQIDKARMRLGMINYENVSTIVDAMSHKSGDSPGGKDQGNESPKTPKAAQSPVKPRRDFRPSSLHSKPNYENIVIRKRSNSGAFDSVVIHDDVDPFIGLVLASRAISSAERKSRLHSVWTEKKDRDAWEQVDSVMDLVEKSLTDISEELSEGTGSVSVLEWLSLLGLAGYAEVLHAHGFDHLEYMGEGMLDAEDLVEMRVVDPEAQSCVTAAPPPDSSHLTDVQSWLKALGLEHLYTVFVANGYGSLERVTRLQPWQLQLEGIPQLKGPQPSLLLGHHKRLTYAIAQLNMTHSEWASQLSPATRRQSLNFPLQKCVESVRTMSSGLSKSMEDVSFEQDYTDLRPLLSTKQREMEREGGGTASPEVDEEWSTDLPSQSYSRPVQRKVSTVAIRPPKLAQADAQHLMDEVLRTELSLDNVSGVGLMDSGDQWKHSVDTLLNRRLEYNVVYLGSLLLKSQKMAAEEAVSKLKAMNESQGKLPEVVLSISWTGVHFFSLYSGRPISDHSIQHIYYCSQDRRDENVLSYITKDGGLIFCHVFRTHNMESAADIVLTIGQAFEVAYQKIQRARLKTSTGSSMPRETEPHHAQT